ncbi:hypothetical protein [Novosphingobium sp. BW1]|uniref:hypothetical protein n=1 Tax=Novosphingobium sp. BW1 TaxID=2592621 RepID=UPI001293B999|nr:hypothetical protein [Novosphingobium sp. BW1]
MTLTTPPIASEPYSEDMGLRTQALPVDEDQRILRRHAADRDVAAITFTRGQE